MQKIVKLLIIIIIIMFVHLIDSHCDCSGTESCMKSRSLYSMNE